MKILATTLATIALLVSGLTVATMPATATAAAVVPYPHSVPTVCHAKPRPKIVYAHRRVGVRVRVDAGGAHPRGRLIFKATKKPGNKVMWKVNRRYHGHGEIFLLRRLPVGKYRMKVRNVHGPNSVYKNCNTGFIFRVRKR